MHSPRPVRCSLVSFDASPEAVRLCPSTSYSPKTKVSVAVGRIIGQMTSDHAHVWTRPNRRLPVPVGGWLGAGSGLATCMHVLHWCLVYYCMAAGGESSSSSDDDAEERERLREAVNSAGLKHDKELDK